MFKLIINGKNGREESEFKTQEEAIAHYKENLSHWGDHTYEIEQFKEALEDISPRQIRLALLSLGITEEMVDTAISKLSSPEKDQAMIAWKFSTSFVRTYPAISMIGLILGLNEEELDKVWKIGITL